MQRWSRGFARDRCLKKLAGRILSMEGPYLGDKFGQAAVALCRLPSLYPGVR